MNWTGIVYFTEAEFRCKCCGRSAMDRHFIRSLDMARAYAAVPFKITSGFRCEAHNASVGGTENSAHTRGYAVDIRAVNSAERFKILESLIRYGFKRIGVYKSWIHADMDPSLPQGVAWMG